MTSESTFEPLQREELVLTGPRGVLRILALRPAGSEPLPTVLLLGDEGSTAQDSLEDVERLARAGFAVFRPLLTETADRDALGALGLVLDTLFRRPEVAAERSAVLGFGRGGTLAFLLGCTRRLAAVVDVEGPVLYPELSSARPIQPLELALNLEGAFLAFFAAASGRVPASEIELLRDRLSSAARPFDIVVHPRASEGFHDRRRPGFDAGCAEDLWRRVLSFLRSNLEEDVSP